MGGRDEEEENGERLWRGRVPGTGQDWWSSALPHPEADIGLTFYLSSQVAHSDTESSSHIDVIGSHGGKVPYLLKVREYWAALWLHQH